MARGTDSPDAATGCEKCVTRISRSAIRRAARSDDVTGQHGVVVREKGGT